MRASRCENLAEGFPRAREGPGGAQIREIKRSQVTCSDQDDIPTRPEAVCNDQECIPGRRNEICKDQEGQMESEITFGNVQGGIPGRREGGLRPSGRGEEKASLRLAGCRAAPGASGGDLQRSGRHAVAPGR
jgi:hypothetical protein